jgi:Xaa-Pro dipeptidase
MTSRRDFLGTAAALAATPLVADRAFALGSDAAPGHSLPSSAQQSDMPPAIAALRPMRDGVVPISVDERRGRIEKAKRLMRENRIDALMLTGGTSMEYFSGIRWGLSERLLAVFIPVRGSAFLVTP